VSYSIQPRIRSVGDDVASVYSVYSVYTPPVQSVYSVYTPQASAAPVATWKATNTCYGQGTSWDANVQQCVVDPQKAPTTPDSTPDVIDVAYPDDSTSKVIDTAPPVDTTPKSVVTTAALPKPPITATAPGTPTPAASTSSSSYMTGGIIAALVLLGGGAYYLSTRKGK
jgi:hypothetical protein